MPDPAEATNGSQRLDLWLDIACLYRTRSEAQRACRAGKVDVNGQAGRPNRLVRAGDVVVIARGGSLRQTVVVRGFAPHHVEKARARELYEDRTPPPSPELVETRRIERLLRAFAPRTRTAPDRRERRTLRRLKGRE